ncbi:hypothetical protein LFYK43_00340 [Ligilactobacillus salitolerans]|uniref:Uncharacterized protein n=1 Tax=Ligilactobacillus salitolerans TaxID=1808352 RepID=A0A401IPY5_9LACO|nr:hypothetical protein [Ligilactobacillus salitolerans]GBG93575.1 hypothetical protein LFYK43_00340 [Ligilactobacillus salitolerans]
MNKTNHFLEIGSSHKKLAVGISGAVVAVLAVGGVGFASMNSHPAAQIAQTEAKASNNHKEQLNKVSELRKQMENEKNDQRKLDDLKKIELKYQKYEKGPDSYRKLTNAYQDAIHSGKAYFLNKTNKTIQDLTVKDVNKENDVNGLNKKIKSLQGQLKFVNDNKEAVFTEDNVKNYTKQINGLIKKYQDRVKKLDEQKKNDESKKAEESKKSEQSSQAAQSSQQNQANGQNQSNNGQSNGNGQGSVNGNSSYRGNSNSGNSNSYSGRSNSSYSGNSNRNYSSNGVRSNSYSQPRKSGSNGYIKPNQPSQPSRPANNSGNGKIVGHVQSNHNGNVQHSTTVSDGKNTTVYQDGKQQGGFTIN